MEVTTATPHDFDRHLAMAFSSAAQLDRESMAVPSQRNLDSAALRLQKVYRSYRTRRWLADTAVVVEELWWQVIDYARLNHSTVSFFNFQKPETAVSRWNRVSLNASKVGKGLSKDAKALKLAFRHWIEAIDPRHRYGHSLHLYYDEWCRTDSGQPFFYWLDIGDGRDVDLKECPRSLLRQQCIKYLGPQEREHYEFVPIDGKIVHKLTGEFLDTTKGSERSKWIFVMSTVMKLYAGQKRKGAFHHSSFLAGGATLAAGRFVVEAGVLKCIWPYSGHYRPTEKDLDIFLTFLAENGINLDEVLVGSSNDEENYYNEEIKTELVDKVLTPPKTSQPEKIPDKTTDRLTSHLTEATPETESIQVGEVDSCYKRSLSGGIKSPRMVVPQNAILERINSKKAMGSYQLGNQLSRKWSTGAGPRIGCVNDYPLELRVHALEIAELSPRVSTPIPLHQVAACMSPLSSMSPKCGPQFDQRNGDVALDL